MNKIWIWKIAVGLLGVVVAHGSLLGQIELSPFANHQFGEHSVGFKSEWILDTNRTYKSTFDEGKTYGASKSPRPILVNVWYPANAEKQISRNANGEYLSMVRTPGKLGALSEKLESYARNVVVNELFEKNESELSQEEQTKLKRFLNNPTRSFKDCQSKEGSFPIVVYHSGAGSSFDDNSAFCEMLASHGYVVVGSAFLRGDGSWLAVDGQADSASDIACLVNFAVENHSGDWRRVGIVGHSLGAQAIMHYLSESSHVVDTAVLLDSTLDYYSHAAIAVSWRRLFDRVARNTTHINVPLLVVASPEAAFGLVDQFEFSDRTYLTVPDLGHNEFISQGIFKVLLNGSEENSPDDAKPSETRAVALEYYRELGDYVVSYLDAKLKNKPNSLNKLDQKLAKNKLGEPALRIEFANAGETGPPRFVTSSTAPPTPRQFPYLIRDLGVEKTIETIDRFKSSSPKPPFYDSSMLLGSTLFELVRQGNIEESQKLYEYLKVESPNILSGITFLGDMCVMTKRKEDARIYYDAAVQLDPENSTFREKLSSLDE